MAVTRFDGEALRQGGIIALVVAVPASVAARWLADRDGSSPWVVPLVLVACAGFALGAGVAAWIQRTGFPLVHGVVCAGGTYLAAQAVFVVVKLLRGGKVNWMGTMVTLSAVLFAGVVGGALGSALQKRGFVPKGSTR